MTTRRSGIIARQWYLSALDAADYDVSKAIDALVRDLPNAPEGEHRVIDRAGITSRLQDAIKATRIRVASTEKEAETVPLFVAILVQGRRVRAKLLRLDYAQTVAVAHASRERTDRNEAETVFLEHNAELYAKHPALPDMEAVYAAEGIEWTVLDAEEASGTEG